MHSHTEKLKEYRKQYYNLNKEKLKVQHKQYYKKYFEIHKEEIHKRGIEYNHLHKEERKLYRKKYYQSHAEEIEVKRRKYSNAHKMEKRQYHLRHTYNIDINQFNAMLKSQNNKCAICGKQFGNTKATRPYIDHSHTTGTPRGILCLRHNLEIGYYERMSNYADVISEYISSNKYNLKYPSSEGVKRYRKQILEKQNYKCAICGCKLSFNKSALDHDHETLLIRGVICYACNLALEPYLKMLKYKDTIDTYLQGGNQYKLEAFVK